MRILLIEDHPIVRMACRELLHVKAGMEVIEVATSAMGLREARRAPPDIVVLDVKLPDGNGLDLLVALLEEQPDLKIIVFSMYGDPAFARHALAAGARGYLTKNDDPDALLQAVDTVGRGAVFLTPAMAEELAVTDGVHTDLLRGLSPRERQVLALLGQGKTLAEIADDLGISYRMSAHAAAQIKTKLGIASTAALIKWAVDHAGVSTGMDRPGSARA